MSGTPITTWDYFYNCKYFLTNKIDNILQKSFICIKKQRQMHFIMVLYCCSWHSWHLISYTMQFNILFKKSDTILIAKLFISNHLCHTVISQETFHWLIQLYIIHHVCLWPLKYNLIRVYDHFFSFKVIYKWVLVSSFFKG